MKNKQCKIVITVKMLGLDQKVKIHSKNYIGENRVCPSIKGSGKMKSVDGWHNDKELIFHG